MYIVTIDTHEFWNKICDDTEQVKNYEDDMKLIIKRGNPTIQNDYFKFNGKYYE